MSLQGTGDLRITSLSHALRAGAKPAFASGVRGAVDDDHRLLMAVRGHLGGTPRPSSCCCRSSDQRHRTDPRPRTTPGTETPWPSSPAPGVPPAPCARLVLLRPSPEPDSCRNPSGGRVLSNGLCLTGSGRNVQSHGGFGGGHLRIHPHARRRQPNLINTGNVLDTGAMITFTATGPLTVKT
jgi:hypothetical protein